MLYFGRSTVNMRLHYGRKALGCVYQMCPRTNDTVRHIKRMMRSAEGVCNIQTSKIVEKEMMIEV